jgi:hypothetical protein
MIFFKEKYRGRKVFLRIIGGVFKWMGEKLWEMGKTVFRNFISGMLDCFFA